jgi:hypothetical protein
VVGRHSRAAGLVGIELRLRGPADREVGPRDLVLGHHEVGEVLGAHTLARFFIRGIFAEVADEGCVNARGELVIVDRRRGAFSRKLDLRQSILRHARGAGDVEGDPFDPAEQLFAGSLAVGANGELQLHLRRDDVVLGAAMNGSDRHNARLEWRELPTDQALESDDDLGRDVDRIFALVRRGTVGTDPIHRDINTVRGRGNHSAGYHDPTRRLTGRNMEGERVIRHAESVVEPILEHRLGSADALLGGLPDEHHRAGPTVAHGDQSFRRAHHRRDVDIVPTGVHHRLFDARDIHLGDGRGIGKAGVLTQRQTVHVGPDHYQRPVAVAEHADHARATDALGHLETGSAQLLGESSRRFVLTKRELGMAVEPNEQIGQRGLVVLGHRLREILPRPQR